MNIYQFAGWSGLHKEDTSETIWCRLALIAFMYLSAEDTTLGWTFECG